MAQHLPVVDERFKRAGYVEATVAFRCGTCDWAAGPSPTPSTWSGQALAVCGNPQIQALVDPVYGCCNHWKNDAATVRKW